MHLLKIVRLVWTFYKNFILLSLTMTALCLWLFRMHGNEGFFGIFWCKLASLGLTYYFVNSGKKNEYYYYQNLGVSKKLLWVSAVVSDIALFIILLIIQYRLR